MKKIITLCLLIISIGVVAQNKQEQFKISALNGSFTSHKTGDTTRLFEILMTYNTAKKTSSAVVNGNIVFTVKMERWGPDPSDPLYPTLTLTEKGSAIFQFGEGTPALKRVSNKYEIYNPDTNEVYLILEFKK